MWIRTERHGSKRITSFSEVTASMFPPFEYATSPGCFRDTSKSVRVTCCDVRW